MWWLGLRDVEKERYTTDGANFEHDERDFRGGFEAALQLRNRNPSYEERFQQLGNRDARAYASEAFKRGYERGRQYLEVFRRHAKVNTVKAGQAKTDGIPRKIVDSHLVASTRKIVGVWKTNEFQTLETQP
jgi:hypothetical protein